MIEQLESLTDLGASLASRARERDVLAIWRAQCRALRRVVVQDGKTEETSTSSSSGHGIQVWAEDGRTCFAARDDFRPDEAVTLLERTVRIAKDGARLGLEPAELPALEPGTARSVPDGLSAFERVDLGAVARMLSELQREVAAEVRGVSLKSAYVADLDAWRIFRSDRTDVLFAMPRCVLRVTATSASARAPHSVGSAICGPDPMLPWDPEARARLKMRALEAARLARDLPDAPAHPAGSFPLVIDYALAKGLAHEAFGHASEADAYRSSILARGGKFRVGEVVGGAEVSIVDEPLPGDHAWQPWSSNGIRRSRAVIVDHGRLADGLADPWSARAGGVRVIDAARAESFRNAPLPRMSNIRLEVDRPLAAPGAFESYGPPEVRDLLQSAQVFKRHPRVVFLSGYSGGQVNPASGDFVFNCKAIYSLTRDRISFHRPAILAGSMFGALCAVREAFGPLKLDALGTCGKWGQSVPSSGGSHYFVVLDPDPSVRLGGS